jgi:hypothetical protein
MIANLKARWFTADVFSNSCRNSGPQPLKSHPERRPPVVKRLLEYQSLAAFRIYCILDRDLTGEAEELTATVKLRRQVILPRHKGLIDDM